MVSVAVAIRNDSHDFLVAHFLTADEVASMYRKLFFSAMFFILQSPVAAGRSLLHKRDNETLYRMERYFEITYFDTPATAVPTAGCR